MLKASKFLKPQSLLKRNYGQGENSAIKFKGGKSNLSNFKIIESTLREGKTKTKI
jgi:hypothetical protein